MGILTLQLFTGVAVGATLLLIAIGLTFTFGQMNVINMAHGEFIMAGAYTAYVLQKAFTGGDLGVILIASLPAAFAVAAGLGLLLELSLIRWFYDRPLDTLLLTWGVSLVLQQLARVIFGAPNVEVRAPTWLRGGVRMVGVSLPSSRLFILVLVAVAMVAIWIFLNRLPHGRRMRAVMQNRPLAACSGINTRRVDTLTFCLGSGLAGLAGVGLTLLGSIGPTLGTNYIVDAFLVVVVGGLGQLRGAILAALALGMLNASVEFWTQASLAKVIVFVAIVVFLQFRPQGLVAQRARGVT